MSTTDEPVLRCPECSTHRDGIARIGNRKTKCRTCNRFAQAVRRLVARRLTDAHPDEAQRLRLTAEVEVYDQITHASGTRYPVGTTDEEETP